MRRPLAVSRSLVFACAALCASCTNLDGLSGNGGGSGGGTSLVGDGDFTNQSGGCGPDWSGTGATLGSVEPGKDGGKACRVCGASGNNGAELHMTSTRLGAASTFAGKRLFATAFVKLPPTGVNGANLAFHAEHPSGTPISSASASVKGPGDAWLPFQATFDVPADVTTLSFEIHAQVDGHLCVDVDEVSVTEVAK